VENVETVARFAASARAYCAWVEGAAGTVTAEMASARRHLARLYAQALDLPQVECGDVDAPHLSHEAWQRVFRRFAALPLNYYWTCDPLVLEPAAAPTMGDLADDLADIWRDLKGGLALFDAGHVQAAAWEWREHFQIHWGRHAASALYVIECWMGAQSRYGA